MGLTVFKIGAEVKLGNDCNNSGIPAKVIAIQIQDNNHITYRVSWWDGNTRHHEWVDSLEVVTQFTPNNSRTIGFKP